MSQISQVIIADNRMNYIGRVEYRLVLRLGVDDLTNNYVIQRSSSPERATSWSDVAKIGRQEFIDICKNHWLMNPGRDQSAALHDYVAKQKQKLMRDKTGPTRNPCLSQC